MYRNLSPKALGITGRQSEIIELALTYGFRGMELDVVDFLKRVEHHDLEHAARFIRSAQLKIGGFELPMRWRGDEELYKADLDKLDHAAQCAAAIGARCCHTQVQPGSDDLPYHENFEMHRARLGEMAEVLARHEIRLGLGFAGAPCQQPDQPYQFIREAEALGTLIKSVAHSNVGLMLDTWNWHFGGGTRDLLLGLGSDVIVSVFLAGAPADATRESIAPEQRLLPFDGSAVDNATWLGTVHEMGYDGPVTAAPHPRSFTGRTRDWIVQQCGSALEDLWRAIGLSRVAKPPASVAAENS
jgi:sugar phosphate isomerase/epimerase